MGYTICDARNDILDLQECVRQLKAAPTSTPSLVKTFRTCCVGISGATVNQAGGIVARCGDPNFNIVRTDTGLYDITPPPGAIFAHIEAIEGPETADSIEAHMGTSFTGGTAWIGEGDNGANPNTPRDRPFSIIWFGDKMLLQDAELVVEGGGSGDEFQELTDYQIRQWSEAGFFNTDQMNAQIQIFNPEPVSGVANWSLRFRSNYRIDTASASSGYTLGNITEVDNGTDYSYVIPVTGVIPGNNGNLQLAVTGTRHPSNTDSTPSHSDEILTTP